MTQDAEVHKKLVESLEFIQKLNLGDAEIAKTLSANPSFGHIERMTIYRWRALDLKTHPVRNDAAERIIRAAEILGKVENKEVASRLRIAVIKNAPEALPALILPYYPQWQEKHNVCVRLLPVRSRREALRLVEEGKADIAVAPSPRVACDDDGWIVRGEQGFEERRARAGRQLSNNARRFFDVGSIRVSGLFPEFSYSGKEFAQQIEDMGKKGSAVGCLPDCSDALHGFMYMHDKHANMTPVRNLEDAVKKFKSGEISALMGTPVLVEACQKQLRKYLREHPRNTDRHKFLGKLELVPESTFGSATMDVYINPEAENASNLGKLALKVMHESVERLNDPRLRPVVELSENVRQALSLEDKDIANTVHSHCHHRIDDLETDTLMKLLKEPGAHTAQVTARSASTSKNDGRRGRF